MYPFSLCKYLHANASPLLFFGQRGEFMLEREAVFRYSTSHGGGEASNSNPSILSSWANALKFIVLSEMEIIEPLPR